MTHLKSAFFCGGAIGVSCAMWEGPSPKNIGETVIHAFWGGNIAAQIFGIIVPEQGDKESKITRILNVALKVIFYVGTLFLYQDLNPSLSFERCAVVSVCSVSAILLLAKAHNLAKNKNAPVWTKNLCIYSGQTSFSLFLGSVACGIASLPVFKKV